MTPGQFLREARERHHLGIADLVPSLATIPPICAHDRAEWLALVEADRAPVTIDVGLALFRLLGFDWNRLVSLVAATASDPQGGEA